MLNLYSVERIFKDFGEDIEIFVFAESEERAIEMAKEVSEDFKRTIPQQINAEKQEVTKERVLKIINAGG